MKILKVFIVIEKFFSLLNIQENFFRKIESISGLKNWIWKKFQENMKNPFKVLIYGVLHTFLALCVRRE